MNSGPAGQPGEKGELGPIGPPGRDGDKGEKGIRGKRGKRVNIRSQTCFRFFVFTRTPHLVYNIQLLMSVMNLIYMGYGVSSEYG